MNDINNLRYNPPRDIAAAVVGTIGTAMDWATRGPLALLNFTGPALKKLVITDESSKAKRFWLGVVSFVVGGFTGLGGYLLATPGADRDVQASRGRSYDRFFRE